MASNQLSNQRRSTARNQASESAYRPTRDYSKEASRDYGSLSDVAGQSSGYWERGEEQMRECVRGHEGTAMLLALGAGLGVGLVIGASIGHSRPEPRGWRDRLTAEGFGRRLMDRIESMIPNALAEHFAK
jgi:hypothetical protein